jgi:hypothetical protein
VLKILTSFLLIFVLGGLSPAKAVTRSCFKTVAGSRLSPFTFPSAIDSKFQEEMRSQGLSKDVIAKINRTGLGAYDSRENKRYSLFTHPLTDNLDPLVIYKIYQAAARAIDLSRKTPPSRPTTMWDVVRAVEFHEVLHSINHDFSMVTEPFAKIIGERSESSVEAIVESINASYIHLKTASGRYEPSPEILRRDAIEELLVTLLWEETLYGNADRVIDGLNSRLAAADQIPKEPMLKFIREESKNYVEDRERVSRPTEYWAKEMEAKRIQSTPEVQAELPRIMQPPARPQLSDKDIQSLELGPVFGAVGYSSGAAYLIRDSRLLQPVHNDNAELNSRIEAQRDMDIRDRDFSLVRALSRWQRQSTGDKFLRDQKEFSLLFSGKDFDVQEMAGNLGRRGDEEKSSITAQELKDLGYFQVVTLMNDMLELNKVLSYWRLKSARLKAIQMVAQSIIDPKNEMGLQFYFDRLTNGPANEREKILYKLVQEKWPEIQKLKKLFQEVEFLLALYDLGAYIGGTAFPLLLDPATNPPTVNIELGKNPTLIYQYRPKYGETKPSKEVVPNSLVPFENAVQNFGGDSGINAIVVYGANEDGKSTYLRTMGGLVMLASIGARLPVQRAEITPMPVYSALNSGDSLQKGLSHHAADVVSINSVVQLVQKNPYALILVDELATGTIQQAGNATEVAYMEWFIQQNSLLLLATHRMSTIEDTKLRNRIHVAVASQYALKIGTVDPEALYQGSIRSLEKHGTPPEIVQRALEILKSMGTKR